MKATKPAPVAPVCAAYIKGICAAGRYAGVSEKIASAWVRAGYLKPMALSKRLHLFRPKDVERAVELAAQAYADKCPREGEE